MRRWLLVVWLAACSGPPGAPADAALDAAAPDAGPDASLGARGVPVIPVGYDAYRLWERMPLVHIGERAYMRSTYDRYGGNEAADASHFLRQDGDTFVTLDAAGPGVLEFVRTNHWHGSPWHYIVDGDDHLVTETSTATPDAPVDGSTFLPAAALPSPLTFTWAETKGADLNWVPIPFARSLTLAYGRTHYGTGYYIYHLYPDGADNLSAPLTPWDGRTPPPADVLGLLGRAGADIAPPGDEHAETVDVPAAGSVAALELAGPAVVRRLALDAPRTSAVALARAHLVIRWDDGAPAVDAPIGLLFGSGSLYNRDDREYLVKGLLASVRFDASQVHLALYFPMPFSRRATVSLVGAGDALPGIAVSARTLPDATPALWQGYFHASFRDHGTPVNGHDLVVLDTRDEGGDFCGSFQGMSFTFSDHAVFYGLEGDPRFFFDDAESPQAYGTGTEEWAGGGDYWGMKTMTLPLAGHPAGAPDVASAQSSDDQLESAYRFLLADAMPFGKNARIQLEHGGVDEWPEHYRTVAYWYGRPGACLRQTDALHVGDPADEAAHGYASPTASAPSTISSRWDGLGVDQFGATEIYPTSEDTGRTMTGTSEFTLALAPENLGVLLRRKLDYSLADQRAEVWVADAAGGPFERAGVWYLAGSNTCVFSNPDKELGVPTPMVETSNRRWRDDEFLLPRRLTEGRARIRVQIRFAPIARPVVPGGMVPAPAWSEVRYTAYSYVL
jgi:hypothetical protein